MASDIGGVWRTVGGRRIFIKSGQDLSGAMKESGKFKKNNLKEKLKKEGYKEQLDLKGKGTGFFKKGDSVIDSKTGKEYGKKKDNKNANIGERKSDDVLTVKNKSLISKEKALGQIKSEEYKNEIKTFIDENNKGNLAYCKEVSEKVASDFKNVGIEAKSVDVSVYSKGGITSTNGHSVTEVNNKLYDFTGKQYLDESTSKGVELRIYEENSNGIYSEKPLKINDKMSDIEKIQIINKHTEGNPNNLILYKNRVVKSKEESNNIFKNPNTNKKDKDKK